MNLRKCKYKDEHYHFHTWFQDGAFGGERYGGIAIQSGEIRIGAILEDDSGQVHKVFDVTEIKFYTN